MNQIDNLDLLVRARYPVIAIASHEENRVMAGIDQVAGRRNMAVFEWSFVTGFFQRTGSDKLGNVPKINADQTIDPIAALAAVYSCPVTDVHPTMFVMKDLHRVLGNPSQPNPKITRFIRDIAARFEVSRHNLILVAPDFQLPSDLEKTVAVLDWPLPDADELADILARCEADLPSHIPVTLNGNRDQVIQALRGLTAFEASGVLTSGIVANRELSEGVIPFILREKAQIIRKAGVLEYFDNSVTMQDVGGLSLLKVYAQRKHAAFGALAREAGLDAPRGLLLVGVPGTGKSLAAKAIAGAFAMPLLRMDVGALMGGLVGQSEANTRSALKVAEAVAPAVLWIDEIEKALGSGGGEQDGGTSKRVFGTILTWMQERTSPVYIIATANDISALRPELISRFDDVIFVDLPALADREEIIYVHLFKRGKNPDLIDVSALANALWGYSGREIEKVIRAAMEAAYCDGEELTTDHLLLAAAELVPVTVTMHDQIEAIREWSVTSQARMAAEPLEQKPSEDLQGGRLLDL